MNEQTVLALGSILTAGLTMAIGAIGAALGESRIGAAGLDALARQPDESGAITRSQFVSLAMVESTAIFCLVIALVLLFANPFISESAAAAAAAAAEAQPAGQHAEMMGVRSDPSSGSPSPLASDRAVVGSGG
jgi:F-type H+-transporting ATPase subunit c